MSDCSDTPSSEKSSVRDDPSAFGERLTSVVNERWEKAAQAARFLGLSKQTLNHWLGGRSFPRADQAIELSDKLGISPRWLIKGEGERSAGLPSSDNGFVLVPKFEVQASAGGGADNSGLDRGPSQMIAFREEWLRSIGVNPAHAQALMARGDSMEPTIRDGDLLLVDRFIHRVIDEGIYVVTVAGLVVVKRLQMRRDGTLVLMSDNRRYTDEVVPPGELDTIVIEGRVRWIARTA